MTLVGLFQCVGYSVVLWSHPPMRMLSVLQSGMASFQPFHHQLEGAPRSSLVTVLSPTWIWLQQFQAVPEWEGVFSGSTLTKTCSLACRAAMQFVSQGAFKHPHELRPCLDSHILDFFPQATPCVLCVTHCLCLLQSQSKESE